MYAVLKAGESEKILMEATTNGNRDILPYLLARRDKGLDSRRFIDPILVNTYGQTEIVDEALDELKSALEDLQSNDGENRREAYVARSFATEKLAEFKTRKAYLALYRALDDTKKAGRLFW